METKTAATILTDSLTTQEGTITQAIGAAISVQIMNFTSPTSGGDPFAWWDVHVRKHVDPESISALVLAGDDINPDDTVVVSVADNVSIYLTRSQARALHAALGDVTE